MPSDSTRIPLKIEKNNTHTHNKKNSNQLVQFGWGDVGAKKRERDGRIA